jgi:putative glutamine amidotransferase
MRPLIGITARTAHDEEWCPPLIGARQGYIDAIVQAGGTPVLLPPIGDMATLRAMFEGMDGLLLTGGVDVAPELYGEAPHPKLGKVQAERDAAELPLARWAVAEGKPVLGICRGIQMLNVALGGTLYQDIEAQCPQALDHEISFKHECWERLDHGLRLDEASRLAEILGAAELEVNSLHHQALKDIAPGLRVVGRAPDGVVEAVEGTGAGFVVGVQCHPEQLWQEADTRWRKMFRALILAAQGR